MTGLRSLIKDRELEALNFEDEQRVVLKKNDFFPDDEFRDYAPTVFARLRRLYGIEPSAYLHSLAKDNTALEMPSAGKSGSIFYICPDGRYMIKTISREEAVSLKAMLPAYLEHHSVHPTSLLARVCGFHQLRTNLRKVYLVVLVNILNTSGLVDVKYDLKGAIR